MAWRVLAKPQRRNPLAGATYAELLNPPGGIHIGGTGGSRTLFDEKRLTSLTNLLADKNLFERFTRAAGGALQRDLRGVRMGEGAFVGLLAHLGVCKGGGGCFFVQDDEYDARWRMLAAKYAQVPAETGQLTQAQCARALRAHAQGRQGVGLGGFRAAMRDLALTLIDGPKAPSAASTPRAPAAGAVPTLPMRKLRSAKLLRDILAASEKAATPSVTAAPRQPLLADSRARAARGSETERGRPPPEWHAARRGGGAETERGGGGLHTVMSVGPANGAPAFELHDLGAGYFKVSVDGQAPSIVRDDASKLLFARQARFDLRYTARKPKQDADEAVRPPWGVSAAKGAWADGSFAFDPARIAGRTVGPEGAKRDPYKSRPNY